MKGQAPSDRDQMQIFFLNSNYNQNVDFNVYQFGREQAKPGGTCLPSIREHYILHLMLGGKGVFVLDGVVHQIRAGQAFMVFPNILCSYQADNEDPYCYAWVEFDGVKARECLKQIGLSPRHPVYTPRERNDDSVALLNQLIESNGNEMKVLAYLVLLLESMMSNSQRQQMIRSNETMSSSYVRYVINYISLNYWQNLSVEKLAQMCGIHRSYLSRIFSAQTGQSLQRYILVYRMNLACNMMLTTQANITDIARSVGYDDPLNFSRAFHKEKGCSPSQWRSAHVYEGHEKKAVPGTAVAPHMDRQ